MMVILRGDGDSGVVNGRRCLSAQCTHHGDELAAGDGERPNNAEGRAVC